MNVGVIWLIVICCGGREMGQPVECSCWDVLSRLAAYRERIPAGWEVDAYPKIA